MKRFTDSYIKSIKPTGKRFEITEPGGLMLRVSASGAKTFCWVFKFDGANKRLTLGKYPALSLTDARLKLLEAKQNRDKGIDPTERDRGSISTVKDLAEDFYRRYIVKHQKNHEHAKRNIDVDIIKPLGRIKLDDLTSRKITVYLETIVDRGSPVHANTILGLIKQMLNYAVSKGILEVSQAQSIKTKTIGGIAKPRDRALSMAEIKTVWQFLDSDHHKIFPGTILATKILLLTGVRSGELRTAEWKEIDFDNNLWTVPKEKYKTGIEHKIHLAPLTKNLFLDLYALSGCDFVMPSQDGTRPMNNKTLSMGIGRIQERIEIPKWTAHDLRRTFATRNSEDMKVEPYIIEKCLGHKMPKIFETYNRNEFLPEREKALNNWAERVENIVSNKNVVALTTSI